MSAAEGAGDGDSRPSAWRARAAVTLLGLALGALLAGLVAAGNPRNAGLCGACFLRDWAGALGLHGAASTRYARPEVVGVVLGALAAALFAREHRPRGGGAPLAKLFLGAWTSIGALVFLGCPFRMLQRLGGGDLNALAGLGGLVVGIGVALWLTRRGCDLGRTAPVRPASALLLPLALLAGLLGLIAGVPGITTSDAPPGSLHAAWPVSLGGGLVAGVLLQRARFCTLGAFRNALFDRDPHLLCCAAGIVVAFGVGAALTGTFRLGVDGQPIAHADALWNALSMALVGLAASLAGGCPVRQLVLTGEGDTGAATTVVGMILGAALAHSFLAVSGPTGPTGAGKGAVVLGLACCLAFALASRPPRAAAA